MARLINKTRRDIVLQTRHVIPVTGYLDTTDEVIRCPDNWPRLNGLIIAGDVVAEYDDAPVVAPVAPPEPAAPVAEPVTVDDPVAVADTEAATPKATRQKT